MSADELKSLLDGVPDTLEIVLRGTRPEPALRPVHAAWRDAREEARRAFVAWADAPCDAGAYVAYRAAQDREDAAQDALSRESVAA